MLPPGTRIAHYTIDRLIGAGGMGEVYRGVDGTLGRAVALKILSGAVTADSSQLKRFMREAQTASSLNHPNIVTIHEMGSQLAIFPGGAEQTAHRCQYIAMELVDGTTLRDAMDGTAEAGPLFTIMAQAADGVARAHEAGIVHRDLKPENLMITRDGYCKVLDFGLAKNLRPLGNFSTVETAEGMIVGTVAYMSPEQVSGKTLDARSDIFSFGSILYELSTGRQPFESDNALGTFHKILYADAPDIETLNPSVDPELAATVRRCLAKDPAERYQSIRDVAVDLRRVTAEPQRSPIASVPVVPLRRRTAFRFASAALAILAVAALLTFAVRRWPSAPEANVRQPFLTRLAQARFHRVTNEGSVAGAVVSPDGKYLLYTITESPNQLPTKQSLWFRQLSTTGSVRLFGPDMISGVHFSPDASFAYFSRLRAKPAGIFRIGVLGGIEQKIVETRGSFTFSPDGSRIAFFRDQGIWTSNLDGSAPQRLTPATTPLESAHLLAWSPDGKHLAFATMTMSSAAFYATVGVVDRTTGAVKPLGTTRWGLLTSMAWAPDSASLLVTSDKGDIESVSISDGLVRTIIDDDRGYGSLSLSRSGDVVAAVQSFTRSSIWQLPGGDVAKAVELTRGEFANDGRSGLDAGPDGSIVYGSNESGTAELWIMRPDGTQRRQLTSDKDAVKSDLKLSPDGTVIAFSSRSEARGAKGSVWVFDLKTNTARLLVDRAGSRPLKFSKDGQAFYAVVPAGETQQLQRIPLAGGPPIVVYEGEFISAEISHDERHALLMKSAGAGFQTVVEVLSLPAKQVVDSFNAMVDVALTARWSPDDTALDYIVTQRGVSNLWRRRIRHEPRQLTFFRELRIYNFAWTDTGALLCARGGESSDVVVARGF